MKPRSCLAALALFLVGACGSSTGTVYTLKTGTYKLNSVSAVSPDNCNLADTFPNGTTIGITVENGTATFDLSGSGSHPDRNPVSTITDNTLAEGSKTYSVPSDSASCTEQLTVTVDGEISADNELSGTLKYASQASTGSTGCTASLLQYKAYPCASTLTFVATTK